MYFYVHKKNKQENHLKAFFQMRLLSLIINIHTEKNIIAEVTYQISKNNLSNVLKSTGF